MTLAIEMLLHDKHLRENPDMQPQRATAGAAAIDLRACCPDPLQLSPGDVQIISAGLAIHINEPGYCGIIVPRSGLGSKHGIVLANTVGVIDSDYTGEIRLAAINRGKEEFVIEPYMRLCQMMFVPVAQPELQQVNEFSCASARGSSGFGSTGTS